MKNKKSKQQFKTKMFYKTTNNKNINLPKRKIKLCKKNKNRHKDQHKKTTNNQTENEKQLDKKLKNKNN